MILPANLKIAVAILVLIFAGWLIYVQNSGQPEAHGLISTPETSDLTNQPKQILFQLVTACPPKNVSCDQSLCQSFKHEFLQNLASNLDNQQVAPDLQQQFETYEVFLSDKITVSIVTPGQAWLITDPANQQTYYVVYDNIEGMRAYRINDNFPDFPSAFTSQIPHDVDKGFSDALLSKAFDANHNLVDSQQLALAQRLHDIFSWQSFLAINWPVDSAGKASPSLTDTSGTPRWRTWMNSADVFKADGSKPTWGTPDTNPLVKTNQVSNNPNGDQLWDQHGNLVYYQMLINEVEFTGILCNNLYNRQGQIQFQPKVDPSTGFFDWGEPERNGVGSIELKLAWKILDPSQGDIPSRYFTRTVEVAVPDPANPDQQKLVEQEVGLVGMHIAHKTLSSFTWLWSTFEHVDNIQVNELEVVDNNGQTQPLKPSFYDPTCPTCPVNVPPTPDANGLRKTQVVRVMPIAEATAELNRQVQQRLKDEGSVWQYYELIGTQWPTKGYSAVADTSKVPGMITGESNGNPIPVYLVNSVIETYLQQGNQPAKNLTRLGGSDTTPVFGTSSCMGCHSGTYLATTLNPKDPGPPGSADFSWLLSIEAR